MNECIEVSTKKYLTRRSYQSLMGKLLNIQKYLHPARVFINRVLALFRKNSGKKRIYLDHDFHKDIAWFLKFLPVFNGITYFKKVEVDKDQNLFLDASLTGLGGVWKNRVYATPVINIPNFHLTIVHLEMLNVIIALRLWGGHWRNMRIMIFCDNYSVVQVIMSGKTKDPFLALCIRNIWLLTAYYDIELLVRHDPGIYNTIAVDNEVLQDLLDNCGVYGFTSAVYLPFSTCLFGVFICKQHFSSGHPKLCCISQDFGKSL